MLSFAQIVQGRDSSVLVADDGLVDVLDVLMIFSGKNCNHSNELLRDLKPDLFDKNKFIMRENRRYATLQDIIELITVFPCKAADETRRPFVKIIEDYIKQDTSAGPAPKAALSEDEAFMVGFKRRRMELELSRMEHEDNALAIGNRARELDNRVKEQARILTACAELERINDPSRTKLDTRTRLMIQDAMQSSILCSVVAVPTQNQQQAPSPNTPLTISGVADELGYKLIPEDVKRIGVAAKKRYDELHKDDGETLSKHLQMCGGRPTYVNSYSEKDRDLLAEVIRADQESARKQQKKASKPLNSYFNKK